VIAQIIGFATGLATGDIIFYLDAPGELDRILVIHIIEYSSFPAFSVGRPSPKS
jgi:hypothetical protein